MALDKVLSLQNSAYTNNILESLKMNIRLKRIEKRQIDSSSMFNRLQVIINQIAENVRPHSIISEEGSKDPAFLADHNYASSNSSSGMSTATSSTLASATATSSCSPAKRNHRFNGCSAKRKIIDEEKEYHEFSAEDDSDQEQKQQQQQREYPKQVGDSIILGPNGTEIDMRSNSSIIWSSAASATRQLLGFVFSSDILATHTLTGKPSPAFYGRERPAKMQLDPIKAADIIHCVRSQFKCTEREIRAAITTKCSDTSKKYKRRHQKRMELSNATP